MYQPYINPYINHILTISAIYQPYTTHSDPSNQQIEARHRLVLIRGVGFGLVARIPARQVLLVGLAVAAALEPPLGRGGEPQRVTKG